MAPSRGSTAAPRRPLVASSVPPAPPVVPVQAMPGGSQPGAPACAARHACARWRGTAPTESDRMCRSATGTSTVQSVCACTLFLPPSARLSAYCVALTGWPMRSVCTTAAV
eukprot:1374285-Prymnesium_polylepis.2